MKQLPRSTNLERPLGQGLKRPSRPTWIRAIDRRSLGTAVAALCMIVAAGAISLRERPFRIPAQVVTTTPEAAAPASAGEATAAAGSRLNSESDRTAPAGPSIIRVNPDDTKAAEARNVVVIRDPSAIGQNLRIAHLPDKALIEASDTGPLPIRAADGRRPFDVYARPWSGARGARIALVIGGLGVSQTGTQEALEKLPAEVTLGFAAQGNSLGRWMQVARHGGHEIVMQVPLEPFDYPNVNPGRNTLTVGASADENVEKLHWSLSRITNYTAIMNYMGARFSADPAAMGPLMAELGRRGLAYLDDGSSARSVAPDLALKNGVPFAVSDVTIDGVQDRGEILKKLDQLERTARAKGFAVGTGSAFEVTVDAVSAWVGEAKKRGIEIVPISAVASDPERG
ncbi:divergent polysaccharide deacetylase family protein [Mesorhizobium sp. BAC0120]|uniref:divergent polysaccharide deacetylase family protein n=1 Tax=Mesorhizobium sp. BAC0120 TaxID=3090670 RepID=UPI00298CA2D5|nr:divergent polysaccharide deacetylase family protein [Mesorhizobium sp. BAC0120]MDW6021670.1 divergent polysaccharide deacetylase family protein [Mesorhizobium sp. BAC0120]